MEADESNLPQILSETERLRVRPLAEADIAAIAALWADAEVTRYMGGARDLAEVRRLLMDGLSEPRSPLDLWPVVEKSSGLVVGHCGLLPKEVDGRDEVELVYVIAAGYWGRGYATEAAVAIRDYAFGALGVERLVSLVDRENVASERVALKLGMEFEKETIRPSGKAMRVYAMDCPAE